MFTMKTRNQVHHKKLSLSELSRVSGVAVSILSRYVNGKRGLSPLTAVALERATGIDRRAWLWPEEFENPYFKKSVSAPPCAEAEKRTVGA
jgi:plasmid maintenance system antidote protein VapI